MTSREWQQKNDPNRKPFEVEMEQQDNSSQLKKMATNIKKSDGK